MYMPTKKWLSGILTEPLNLNVPIYPPPTAHYATDRAYLNKVLTWDRKELAGKTDSHWLISVTYCAVIGHEAVSFYSFSLVGNH